MESFFHRIAASSVPSSEIERLEQENLDVKCLQLLRALIHNEIVKLPGDWLSDPKSFTKILKKIEGVQNALNSYEAVLQVLSHLAKNNSDIVREVLAFQAAMLFGGNEKVQESLIEYFLGTREEKFFLAVKTRMQLSSLSIKERRSLLAQHQEKVKLEIDQAKALRKAMKDGKMAEMEVIAANNMGSLILGSRANLGVSTMHLQPGKPGMGSRMMLGGKKMGSRMLGSRIMGSKMMGSRVMGSRTMGSRSFGKSKRRVSSIASKRNQIAPTENTDELTDEDIERMVRQSMGSLDEFDYEDDGYIELVLKLLGLMCDGQNTTLQDYLREQPDNIKSVNLISETARFLSLLYSSIDENTIGLVTELLSTLVEFTSGNIANQLVIFDNKIIDYINFMLRGAQFQSCDPESVLELKCAIINLLTALVEESLSDGQGVADDVAEAVDNDSIFAVCCNCFNRSMTFLRIDEKIPKDDLISLGFKYFHFLRKVLDLSGSTYPVKGEKEIIWKFYERSTLSIEIVKGK